ncbi:MAG: hydroxyacid dehydrogenase [Candidatus Atribacteria bacterium]|nr:hydroxyacid dehydrogenase [Candidatus Atribacteria bacterium]
MTEQIRVLCAFGVPDDMARRLSEAIGPVTVLKSDDEAEIIREIQDKHVFVVRSKPKVTPNIIENAPVLKVVSRPGVGTDNIDKEACKKKGVLVMNTPEASASSVAELTVGLALSLLRYIYTTCALLKNGDWAKSKYTGRTIDGKVWGVLGFGGIGRKVADIVKVMNAQVVAYDPYIPDEEFTKRDVKRALRLEDLLAMSDILSLHVVINDETRGMISENAIRQMKKGSYIINTSRGKVIDQKALFAALESGHLAGAALDVFETEPPTDNLFLCQKNLICTPHIGGSTEEAFINATDIMIRKLRDLLRPGEGGPIGD